MTLDVETPPPPRLTDDVPADAPTEADDEYHRADLERFLDEGGAWAVAFREWAAETDLDRHGYDIAADLELFARYDFFWDEFAQRVGFHAPGLPEDWQERDLHPALDSWGTVSNVNASLTELGRLAAQRLTEEHVDWDDEYEAPDDLPEF